MRKFQFKMNFAIQFFFSMPSMNFDIEKFAIEIFHDAKETNKQEFWYR